MQVELKGSPPKCNAGMKLVEAKIKVETVHVLDNVQGLLPRFTVHSPTRILVCDLDPQAECLCQVR
jgi:hypothetical protein